MPGLVRLIHPAPALAVVALSAALGAILLAQVGEPWADPRLLLTVVGIAGSQVFTGALNDWADRARDAVAQPSKPIPAGDVTPRAALRLAVGGLAVQVAATAPLGAVPFVLGLVASASAAMYDLRLSRTPASVLPYLVSFGILPVWIATGVGLQADRVVAASVLIAPFAAAAHLANTLVDFDVDAALGSRNLGQRLGRRGTFALAYGVALAVGVAVGIALTIDWRLTLVVAVLGVAGVVAVAQGAAGPRRLWSGMLVAAVCWTAAWALATG